jgi:hypothetical protein
MLERISRQTHVPHSGMIIHSDPTPGPVRCYSELWHKDEKTLVSWCRKGLVPGAFRPLVESGG